MALWNDPITSSDSVTLKDRVIQMYRTATISQPRTMAFCYSFAYQLLSQCPEYYAKGYYS